MHLKANKKRIIGFLFLVIFLLSMSPTVFGARTTNVSNPTRTPSLEGDTDVDYLMDFTCDYGLKTFPPRSVDKFRLYIEKNDATPDDYYNMQVKDSNTYEYTDLTCLALGCSGGETVYFYFYILDTESESDTTATYSFSVNVPTDEEDPVISDEAYSPNPFIYDDDGSLTLSATITDNVDVTSADCAWKVNSGSWSEWASMNEGESNVWSKSSITTSCSYSDTIYYKFRAYDEATNEDVTDGTDSFTVGDDIVPTLSNQVHNPDPCWINDNVSVSINASDVSGIDYVQGKYRVNDGSWSDWQTTSNTEGDVYTYYIGYLNDNDKIDYFFYAYDLESNGVQSDTLTFYCKDEDDPILSNPDRNIVNPDENDNMILQVDAEDSISGINWVKCHWRVDEGSWNEEEMSLDTGSTYKYTIGYFNIGEEIDYYFTAEDNSDETATLDNSGNYYKFTVTDQTNPTLSSPEHDPTTPDEEDSITLYVNATDNGDLDKVMCYWRVDEGSWNEEEMSLVEGELYSYSLGTFAIGEVIDYYFTANDTANNVDTLDNSGNYYEFTVTDQTNPTVYWGSIDYQDDSEDSTYGHWYNVTDNGEIAWQGMRYKINSDGEWVYVEFTYVGWEEVTGMGWFHHWVADLGSHEAQHIYCQIYVNDTYGNTLEGNLFDYQIPDWHDPEITFSSATDPNTVTNGTTINVNFTVTDNIGLDTVILYWCYSVDTQDNGVIIFSDYELGFESELMNNVEGNLWTASFSITNLTDASNNLTYYKYSCWANDTFGNYKSSVFKTEQVNDFIDPTVSDVSHSPTDVSINSEITISASSSDNHVVEYVTVYYNDGSGYTSMNLTDGSVNIGKFGCVKTVYYYIYVEDRSGNSVNSSTYDFYIPDEIKPNIDVVSISYSQEVIKVNEGSITVKFNISDNHAVYSAKLYYKFEADNIYIELTWSEIEGLYQHTFDTFSQEGKYYFYCTALDYSGNRNQSEAYSFDIEKASPEVEDKPDPEIEEPIIDFENKPVQSTGVVMLPTTALLIIGVTLIMKNIEKKEKKRKEIE